MQLPQDCKLTVSSLSYEAMMRPKHFLCLELECQSNGMKLCRYVNTRFPLLRVRLLLARRGLIKGMAKFKAFSQVHGVG